MTYSYLPPGKGGSYTYNSAVEQKLKSAKKMILMAPNKYKTNEYNEKLTQAVVKVFFLFFLIFEINNINSSRNWASNILLKTKYR